MKCKTVTKLLSRYIDQRLSEETRSAVDEHLQSCDACRAELALYARVGETLRGALAPAEPAAGLAQRAVNAALSAGRRPEPRSSLFDWLLPAAWPTAAVSAAAAVLLWIALPTSTLTENGWGGTVEAASLGLGSGAGETSELTVVTEQLAATLGDDLYRDDGKEVTR